MADDSHLRDETRIVIIKNGPYVVHGNVPLAHKTQVVSEHGEPLTWKKDCNVETPIGEYALCRCGESKKKPFCDRTHRTIDFDGTECADTGSTADRQKQLPAGSHLVVHRDTSLCTASGFCGTRDLSFDEFVAATDNTQARLLVIGMVERCPSGALTDRVEAGEPDIEPDLPQQIAATTEITADGPIDGPLWVTGGIPIERSDHEPFETRNRVTLCNCGRSGNKPLCDGSHRCPTDL